MKLEKLDAGREEEAKHAAQMMVQESLQFPAHVFE